MKVITLEIIIKKNLALELLCSIKRYSQDERLKDRFELSNHHTEEHMINWLSSTDEKLSLFMKHELKQIFGTSNWYFAAFALLALRNDIDSCEGLLRFIANLTPELMHNTISEIFELDNDLTYLQLEKRLSETFEIDRAMIMFELLTHKDETLERIKLSVPKFYNIVFKNAERELELKIDEQIERHRSLYSSLKHIYTNAILGVDNKFLQKSNSITMYLSYFHEYTALMFEREMGSNIACIFGYQLESKLDKTRMSENRKLLFKVLSDEKRVEILQLVSKRSWYGIELAKHLGITTATLSYHISKLFNLDVLTFEEGENKRLYYKLNKAKLKELFESSLRDIID